MAPRRADPNSLLSTAAANNSIGIGIGIGVVGGDTMIRDRGSSSSSRSSPEYSGEYSVRPSSLLSGSGPGLGLGSGPGGGSHPPHEASRVKLMCSYGGRILPRPHDNHLRYVGGESRIVVVGRTVSFSDLTAKLSRTFSASHHNSSSTNSCPNSSSSSLAPPSLLLIKYQLPGEDLDALISVTSDEDLENMMEEYDRLSSGNRSSSSTSSSSLISNSASSMIPSSSSSSSSSSSRLRLFLFPLKLQTEASSRSNSQSSSFSDTRERWFLDALNGSLPMAPPRDLLLLSESITSSIFSETPPDTYSHNLHGGGYGGGTSSSTTSGHVDLLEEWAAAISYGNSSNHRCSPSADAHLPSPTHQNAADLNEFSSAPASPSLLLKTRSPSAAPSASSSMSAPPAAMSLLSDRAEYAVTKGQSGPGTDSNLMALCGYGESISQYQDQRLVNQTVDGDASSGHDDDDDDDARLEQVSGFEKVHGHELITERLKELSVKEGIVQQGILPLFPLFDDDVMSPPSCGKFQNPAEFQLIEEGGLASASMPPIVSSRQGILPRSLSESMERQRTMANSRVACRPVTAESLTTGSKPDGDETIIQRDEFSPPLVHQPPITNSTHLLKPLEKPSREDKNVFIPNASPEDALGEGDHFQHPMSFKAVSSAITSISSPLIHLTSIQSKIHRPLEPMEEEFNYGDPHLSQGTPLSIDLNTSPSRINMSPRRAAIVPVTDVESNYQQTFSPQQGSLEDLNVVSGANPPSIFSLMGIEGVKGSKSSNVHQQGNENIDFHSQIRSDPFTTVVEPINNNQDYIQFTPLSPSTPEKKPFVKKVALPHAVPSAQYGYFVHAEHPDASSHATRMPLYNFTSNVMIGNPARAVPYVGANPFVDDFSQSSYQDALDVPSPDQLQRHCM